MRKIAFAMLAMFLPLFVYPQITKSDDMFSDVGVFDRRVVFVKEIKPRNNDVDKNYFALKEWGKINFAKDRFNSGVNFDNKKKKMAAESRIELLLPENSEGIREKFIMKYRVDAFFSGGFCIFEISNISYMNSGLENNNTLPMTLIAEDLITNAAISIDDSNKEVRINIRKNTLYFFNDLVNSLQTILVK